MAKHSKKKNRQNSKKKTMKGGAASAPRSPSSIAKKMKLLIQGLKNNLDDNYRKLELLEKELMGVDAEDEVSKLLSVNDEVIEYEGTLDASTLNELEFMKEALRLQNVEFQKMAANIFKNGNIVVQCLGDEFGKESCELAKEAYEQGVGVKYLKHFIVSKNGETQRVYLFTEYLPSINKDTDHEIVERFARKISNTSLLFHPDFWYKNICITENGELKATGWDYNIHNKKKQRIQSNLHAVVVMMMKYKNKLKEHPNNQT